MFELTVGSLFHILGQGTVLAGHVQAGTISVGDLVEVNSEKHSGCFRVSGIEIKRALVASAKAGDDIGILFTDFQPELFPDGIERSEPSGWEILGLQVRHARKPWWQFW